LLGLLKLAPTLFVGAAFVLLPVIAALALVGWYGVETRGRDLRDFEAVPVET
jgi:putative MFS transporter